MTGDQFGAILEDLDDKLDTVIESLSFMATKTDVARLEEKMEYRSVEHEQWLSDHEKRITVLENS